MDYDKLIEQLNAWNEQHLSVVCGGKHFACDYLCENEDCIVVRAATALSTLQAENEKLRAELENYRKGHCAEGGCAAEKDRDLIIAENEKLRAELEQVKRERDAAIERVKRALAMMWFVYVNSDKEFPHNYETEALEEAERILGPWAECMPKYLRRD